MLSTWFAVRPRLLKRVSKASFLGRKMVAFRVVLLKVVARPVTCMAFEHHHLIASAACCSIGAALGALSLSKVTAETMSCLPTAASITFALPAVSAGDIDGMCHTKPEQLSMLAAYLHGLCNVR